MWNFPKAMMAAAVLAAATPAAAAAPNPATVSDMRCLMTMVVLRQNKDNAAAAQAGIYFFGGRISARDPNADLAAIMKAEAPSLTGKAIEPEAQRCGPIITAEMQGVQAALNAMRPPAPPPGTPGAVAPPATAPSKPPSK